MSPALDSADRCTARPNVAWDRAQAPDRAPAFEFRGITAGYRAMDVLSDITVVADPRERIAILGPNGAGKSTLFRVGVGLLQPRKGRVFLHGKDVTALAPDRRAVAGVSFMMQGGRIFPSLSVKENLLLAAWRGGAADPGSAIERVVGTLPVIRERWLSSSALLSGGERHIVALGMALVREPSVLLLDEPSAGLAPGLGDSLLEQTFVLAGRLGVTLLVIEHRMGVLRLADRALILGGGGVVCETSKPSSWLFDGTLEKMFFSRAEVGLEMTGALDKKESGGGNAVRAI